MTTIKAQKNYKLQWLKVKLLEIEELEIFLNRIC